MYKLLPVLIDSMGDAYPELIAQKELIEKVIKEEEESFLRTLETGIRLLDKTMADTQASGKKEISGGSQVFDSFPLFRYVPSLRWTAIGLCLVYRNRI